MKALKAIRVKIKLGDLWESPYLHLLLTNEDVIVERCLDFTVASGMAKTKKKPWRG